MNSKTQIYNITLNILGISTPLENPKSSDPRAILLNNYYELARDCVLKDFDWNFASVFKELSLIEEDKSMKFGFLYCYNYPNDCVCARDLFEKGSYQLQKYSVFSRAEGEKGIYTNVKTPILRYTRRIEKETYFSCEFSMALSYYLASLTSSVISGSIQKGELAYQKYQQIIKHAKYLNAQEGYELEKDVNSTYIEAR